MKRRDVAVLEIVRDYLIEEAYDGLANSDASCGCLADDLAPCGQPNFTDCVAGHKTKCNPRTCEMGGGCEYHIAPGKRRKRK